MSMTSMVEGPDGMDAETLMSDWLLRSLEPLRLRVLPAGGPEVPLTELAMNPGELVKLLAI